MTALRQTRTASCISLERVRELLTYEPDTGVFRWKVRRNYKALPGCVAGRPTAQGYIAITLDRQTFLAHRLAWFYVHGVWPGVIDHRDTIKTNNSIANLRTATGQQNGFNRAAPKHNSSGIKGVSWDAANRKWRAHITPGGKFVSLGRFERMEDAAAAYARAASNIAGEYARQ